MNLLSVIVPVYNVENYLNKCIFSILNSSYKEIELILIDDGSNDKSAEICNEWKTRDKRIKVIHKENRGAGAARNTGLEVASGDFITFVDSDDYISKDMYKCLMSYFNENIDIVECDYEVVYDDNFEFGCDSSKSEKYSMYNAFKLHIQDKLFKQLIWNKIYRKKIVEGIYFPLGKKIDDEYWTYKAIGKANNLIHINKKMYAYRQSQSSVMHLLNEDNRIEAIDAKVERHKYVLNNIRELKNISLINLWISCLYQEQICIRNLKNSNKIEKYCEDILKTYPLDFKTVEGAKMKFWLTLYKVSSKNTCKIRNLLGIGL